MIPSLSQLWTLNSGKRKKVAVWFLKETKRENFLLNYSQILLTRFLVNTTDIILDILFKIRICLHLSLMSNFALRLRELFCKRVIWNRFTSVNFSKHFPRDECVYQKFQYIKLYLTNSFKLWKRNELLNSFILNELYRITKKSKIPWEYFLNWRSVWGHPEKST